MGKGGREEMKGESSGKEGRRRKGGEVKKAKNESEGRGRKGREEGES